MALNIPRQTYTDIYGPTVGDKVRLADTGLFIEVENDHTVYGDESKFGGGKTLRDGMGQMPGATGAEGVLDLVLTNALILDYWGIVKADIGVRDGKIVGIGKSGNPNIMEGVGEDMVVGAGTEVIAAEGLIVTPGGLDVHIHFICPQQIDEALSSGVTTMIGGGRDLQPAPMLLPALPVCGISNECSKPLRGFRLTLGFLGKGNSSLPESLNEQIEAGALGIETP